MPCSKHFRFGSKSDRLPSVKAVSTRENKTTGAQASRHARSEKYDRRSWCVTALRKKKRKVVKMPIKKKGTATTPRPPSVDEVIDDQIQRRNSIAA